MEEVEEELDRARARGVTDAIFAAGVDDGDVDGTDMTFLMGACICR